MMSAGVTGGAKPTDVALVYFDLETTGLSLLKSEIVKIAAKAGEKEFSKYILPEEDISEGSSKVNGMVRKDGQLYLRGECVETTDAKEVMTTFVDFLEEVSAKKPVALVAHNGNRFDAFLIIRDMKRHRMLESFLKTVVGFIDTIPVMRNKVPGLRTYKQEALADHYGISNEHAHDALGDVRILAQIIQKAGIQDSALSRYTRTVSQVALGGQFYSYSENRVVKYGLRKLTPSVSFNLVNRLANHNITFEMLKMALGTEEEFDALVVENIHLSKKDLSALKKSVEDVN